MENLDLNNLRSIDLGNVDYYSNVIGSKIFKRKAANIFDVFQEKSLINRAIADVNQLQQQFNYAGCGVPLGQSSQMSILNSYSILSDIKDAPIAYLYNTAIKNKLITFYNNYKSFVPYCDSSSLSYRTNLINQIKYDLTTYLNTLNKTN